MELVCLSFVLIVVPIWNWLAKKYHEDERARAKVSIQREEQETERVLGTFIFLDAMSHGTLLPPPEDIYHVEEEERDDVVDEYDELDRYRDNEY